MDFTGEKRLRGTRSGRAPSNAPTAAPIAVSSWNTSGEDLSPGSTVFLLTISGSPSTPSRSAISVLSASRSTQRLFVLT